MHVSRRVTRIAATVVAVLALGLTGALGAHNVAHANGNPTIVQVKTTDFSDTLDSSPSFTASFSSNIASGDEVVVLVGVAGGNHFEASSYSDSLSSTFSSVTSAYDFNNDWAGIAYALPSSGGSDSVTVGFTEHDCPCTSHYILASITLVEVSGEASSGSSGSATLAENNTGTGVHITGSGLATANNDLDLALYTDGGSNKTITVPNNSIVQETEMGTNTSPTTGQNHDQAWAQDSQANFTFYTSGYAPYDVVVAVSIASA